MKKLLVLLVILCSFSILIASERQAPFIIQQLGREAQDVMGVPGMVQTAIFVDKRLVFPACFDLQNERIYIAGWILPLLKHIPLGALRFVLGHEAAHKFYFITRKLSLGRFGEEVAADLRALSRLSCYQCLEEFRHTLSCFCMNRFYNKWGRMPSCEELTELFKKRSEEGYLAPEALDEKIVELKGNGELCKYHRGPHTICVPPSVTIADVLGFFFTKNKLIAS
jgi:hypothetical protein